MISLHATTEAYTRCFTRTEEGKWNQHVIEAALKLVGWARTLMPGCLGVTPTCHLPPMQCCLCFCVSVSSVVKCSNKYLVYRML